MDLYLGDACLASSRTTLSTQSRTKDLGIRVYVCDPALGRQKHVGPWISLASWPSLFGEFPDSERPCFEKDKKTSIGCLGP